jgi:hypothetical protein
MISENKLINSKGLSLGSLERKFSSKQEFGNYIVEALLKTFLLINSNHTEKLPIKVAKQSLMTSVLNYNLQEHLKEISNNEIVPKEFHAKDKLTLVEFKILFSTSVASIERQLSNVTSLVDVNFFETNNINETLTDKQFKISHKPLDNKTKTFTVQVLNPTCIFKFDIQDCEQEQDGSYAF